MAFFIYTALRPRRSWGFTPHPTKEDCSSYPPWMLHDVPNGVESPLCSLPNLLSLPKDASMHLRKLARHPCRDSRNLSIRPASTPRGWCIPQTLELLESNQGIKMKPICSFAFNKESSMPFCNFAGKDELLQSQS